MLDSNSWARLIAGLAEATNDGRLQWEMIPGRTGIGGFSIGLTVNDMLSSRVVYAAETSGTRYELSSADAYHRPPYELSATDVSGTARRSIGLVRSTTALEAMGVNGLNNLLESLFKLVSGEVEPPGVAVDRLLDELRE